jgi:hypothetical protein
VSIIQIYDLPIHENNDVFPREHPILLDAFPIYDKVLFSYNLARSYYVVVAVALFLWIYQIHILLLNLRKSQEQS